MFTIHQLDGNGKPHRELARTPFADTATHCAIAIARSMWREEGHNVMNVIPEGRAELLICDNGEPYKQIVLRASGERRWVAENIQPEKIPWGPKHPSYDDMGQ